MPDETATALYEGRAGRAQPLIAPDIAGDSLLHAKLWDNPCWFSFRMNYLALHFNNPIYGFIHQRLGLLRPEFVVLWSLHLGGRSTFSDVVRSSGFPKNTLSRAANKLEVRGLITRETDAGDLRRVTLALTPAGEAAVMAAKGVMIRHERAMLSSLSPAERLSLSEIMTKLVVASADFPQTIDPNEQDGVPGAASPHQPKRETA